VLINSEFMTAFGPFCPSKASVGARFIGSFGQLLIAAAGPKVRLFGAL
jgi:hypothetical protein